MKFFEFKNSYIDALHGSLLALLIFSLAAWLIPGYGDSSEIEVTLTVSTFLFAIFSGFWISRLNSRYDQIGTLLGREDALWISLYRLGQIFGKPFQKKLGDSIDEYYIKVFDYEPGMAYKSSIPEFENVYSSFYKLNPNQNEACKEIFDQMFSTLTSIEETRNLSSQVSRERVKSGQWLTLIFLAALIIFSLFYLKGTSFFSPIVTVSLSTILVLVVLTMRDLERFRFAGYILSDESGEEVLDCMGKLRYHNEKYLPPSIPKHVKKYRIGITDPKTGKKTIRTVENR